MFNQWISTEQVLEQDMECDEQHKFFLLLENEPLSLESTCGKPDLDSPFVYFQEEYQQNFEASSTV